MPLHDFVQQSLADPAGGFPGFDLSFAADGAGAVGVGFLPDQLPGAVLLSPAGVFRGQGVVVFDARRKVAGAADVIAARWVLQDVDPIW